MASLNLFTSPVVVVPQRRVHTAATAAKGSGGGSEEKGLLDFVLGSLTKQDQFYETDPILKKVETKSGGTTTKSRGTTTGRQSSGAVSPAKNPEGGRFGGLAGLFSKKD